MVISDKLRKAVEAAIADRRFNRHTLSQAAGIEYRSLTRWLDEGRDIRASTIDALAECLGLDITENAKPSKPPARKKKKSG
jgi:DNA-binding Xre family transcriptional regulator